jgi:transposase
MRTVTIADAGNVILGLQDEIRRSQEARYDHRLHGVLLVAQGMNCCQVAELLGDAPRTVAYWVQKFEQKGLAGLQEGARSGRPSKLDADQFADLQWVLRGSPSDVGLAGNLWDGKTMAAYLRQTHGVELGARQCRRLLRQLSDAELFANRSALFANGGEFSLCSTIVCCRGLRPKTTVC